MGLFATMDVGSMDTQTVQSLIAICDGMLKEEAAERHRDDYQEFGMRLRSELIRRESAAVKLQAAIRGLQARRQYEAEKELAQQTKAAVVIQQAFRGFQARQALEALRAQRDLEIQQELLKKKAEQERQGRIQSGEQELKDKKIDPTMVEESEKEELGRLLAVYKAKDAALGQFKGDARQKKPFKTARSQANQAQGEFEAYMKQIVDTVEAYLSEQKKQADAARSVTLPADFHREGAMVDYGSFLYPGAGYLKIGDKSYQLHPNRSLVHVRHEVASDATLAYAQAYFDSLLKACRKVIADQKSAALGVISPFIRVDDTTPSGRNFRWSIKYTRYDAKKQARGFSGSIEHIDSGYEHSFWLPDNKRGVCRKCGVTMNFPTTHHGGCP